MHDMLIGEEETTFSVFLSRTFCAYSKCGPKGTPRHFLTDLVAMLFMYAYIQTSDLDLEHCNLSFVSSLLLPS